MARIWGQLTSIAKGLGDYAAAKRVWEQEKEEKAWRKQTEAWRAAEEEQKVKDRQREEDIRQRLANLAKKGTPEEVASLLADLARTSAAPPLPPPAGLSPFGLGQPQLTTPPQLGGGLPGPINLQPYPRPQPLSPAMLFGGGQPPVAPLPPTAPMPMRPMAGGPPAGTQAPDWNLLREAGKILFPKDPNFLFNVTKEKARLDAETAGVKLAREKEAIRQRLIDEALARIGKTRETATSYEWYQANEYAQRSAGLGMAEVGFLGEYNMLPGRGTFAGEELKKVHADLGQERIQTELLMRPLRAQDLKTRIALNARRAWQISELTSARKRQLDLAFRKQLGEEDEKYVRGKALAEIFQLDADIAEGIADMPASLQITSLKRLGRIPVRTSANKPALIASFVRMFLVGRDVSTREQDMEVAVVKATEIVNNLFPDLSEKEEAKGVPLFPPSPPSGADGLPPFYPLPPGLGGAGAWKGASPSRPGAGKKKGGTDLKSARERALAAWPDPNVSPAR